MRQNDPYSILILTVESSFVNGRLRNFTKNDDDKYVFDKNMLAVTQTSEVKLPLDIPTVDKTK